MNKDLLERPKFDDMTTVKRTPLRCILFFIVFSGFILPAVWAQQIKLKSGVFLKNTGVSIVVKGDVNSAGNIGNTGTAGFIVSGNLTNSGTFNAGSALHFINGSLTNNAAFIGSTSTVTFIGSSAQTIGGTQPISFNNLTIKNDTSITLIAGGLTTVTGIMLIDSTKKFIVAAGKQLTVSGTLTNNGGVNGFRIKSDATGTGSVIENNSGVNATVERFVPTNNKYHYVASPITAAFSAVYHYGWLYQWNEKNQYWDNIVPLNVPLLRMRGYSLRLLNVSGNPSIAPNNPAIYTGELNTGTISSGTNGSDTTITYSIGTDINMNGFNLIGNPYPSGIDWDAAGLTKTNIDDALYVWDGNNSRYSSYVNKIKTNGGSNFIGSQQGFFVKARGPATLVMNNSIRTHTGSSVFRGNLDNILKLTFKNDSMTDETVIRFTTDATTNFDGNFDAYKLFGYKTSPQLYTVINQKVYASINSLPEATLDSTKVQLNLSIGFSGNFKIVANGVNSFNNTAIIILEDTKLKVKHDLTIDTIYSFYADTADKAARFIVWFYKTPTEITESTPKTINIYSKDKSLYLDFNGMNPEGAEVAIVNMLGQTVDQAKLSSDFKMIYQTNVASGIYIVRVLLKGKLFEKKVFFND